MRQFPIVSEQQKAFAGVVQTSHGIHPALHAANQIHHGGSLLRVAHGGDVALGLVEQKIVVPLRAVQKLSVDADVVGLRIGFAAEFGHNLAVDLHGSGGDEFLGGSSGSDSGGSDNLLQTFSRHDGFN